MANAGSSSDIVQAIGGDSRRHLQASRKIARWLSHRVWYHRTRLEWVHEYEASKLYTLEQDEYDGTWHRVNYEIDYDYQTEAWFQFLDFIASYPYSYAKMSEHRVRVFKEELMATAWHPNRVEKWLEQGEEVLDMMMGV